MSTISIHPYPRLDSNAVTWGNWILRHNDKLSSEFDLDRDWDVLSQLKVEIAVEVKLPAGTLDTSQLYNQLDAPLGSKPTMHVLVACPETLATFEKRVSLEHEADKLRASANVDIESSRVFGSLILRAWITLPVADPQGGSIPWLENRIVAVAVQKRLRLTLGEMVPEFPTKAISFKEENHLYNNAPWYFEVECHDLRTPFSHDSFELVLNADNSDVLKMIEGKDPKNLLNQLKASLARVQLQTVLRLSEETSDQDSIDEIAQDYPSSITASAQRIAVDHLYRRSLADALNLLRDNPAEFEYLITHLIVENS